MPDSMNSAEAGSRTHPCLVGENDAPLTPSSSSPATPSGTLWIHGLRANRCHRVIPAATAVVATTRLTLGAQAAAWLRRDPGTHVLIGSHGTDIVLIAAEAKALINLRFQEVESIPGAIYLRLDTSGFPGDRWAPGLTWAQCGTVGNHRAVVLRGALSAAIDPDLLLSGIYWSRHQKVGRLFTTEDWLSFFNPACPDTVHEATGIRVPADASLSRRPFQPGLETNPFQFRRVGSHRRCRRAPGHVVVCNGQLTIPADALVRLGDPTHIRIGLRRLGAEVAIILAPAGGDRPGYAIRRHRARVYAPSVRLDTRAAWLHGFIRRGIYLAEVTGTESEPEIVLPDAIRWSEMRSPAEIASFPPEVRALLTGPDIPCAPVLPVMDRNPGKTGGKPSTSIPAISDLTALSA